MVVAELEVFFSRPFAPTRRIALGDLRLPPDGAGEAAGMLLGGIAAACARDLDEDDRLDLQRLLVDVEHGRSIPQPRLRHRFQVDRIGLKGCHHRLVQDRGGFFHLDLEHHEGSPAQQSLLAVYAVRALDPDDRTRAAESVRRGIGWDGALGPDLLGYLRMGAPARRLGAAAGAADPLSWALGVLRLSTADGRPARPEVQRAFRNALRDAHPDHGADEQVAAERIAELDAARRILLG
jgi:hypothetical protein